MAAKKRTIDAFFGAPSSKKARSDTGAIESDGARDLSETGYSPHWTYPFPIANLPRPIALEISSLPSSVGRTIADQPDLDLLYFEPYIPRSTAAQLFRFLRSELPFYRVEYDIQRGGVSTHIRTPRWTTVFGLDATSCFVLPKVICPSSQTTRAESIFPNASKEEVQPTPSVPAGVKRANDAIIQDARSGLPIDIAKVPLYSKSPPRPIPKCLDDLRISAERATGCTFNFCLVNYYSNGADSISFHSDDERFLGALPAIASFSLGACRDFIMKHKPPSDPPSPKVGGQGTSTIGEDKAAKPLKLPLGSGDMILMRGTTQANWLHSIPKRSGKNETDGGRINITFRCAMVKAGTENYYKYNVGTGPVYRWDDSAREMKLWKRR